VVFQVQKPITSAENDECSGCPSMIKVVENVDQLNEPVLKNRTLTINKLANMLQFQSGALKMTA
jgi:hypothetical protein